MQIAAKICLTGSTQYKGQKRASRSLQMGSQLSSFRVSHPVPLLQVFLIAHTSRGHYPTVLDPLKGGWLTSLPPCDIFEHISRAQQVLVLCSSPATHCCLLTKHSGRVQGRQDTAPFKHTTQENFNAKAVAGWVYQAELQIPREEDLCQQIKMLYFIFWFFLYLNLRHGHFLNLKGIT